jgi:hypothetical protein
LEKLDNLKSDENEKKLDIFIDSIKEAQKTGNYDE